MGTNFESKLNKAIGKCEEYFIPESSKFERIYPFITENFTGYEELFELENKSLLTVGSSCDQAINANYYGCKDITIIDLCPYTKEYFYLKKAALLTLSYSDFFEFFCYRDYPKTFKDNKHILNRTAYRSMESILRNLDYESYLFWGELLENFSGERVRRKLFSNDEDKFAILKDKNPYLKDEISYDKTRKNILSLTPTFIQGNIYQTKLKKNI